MNKSLHITLLFTACVLLSSCALFDTPAQLEIQKGDIDQREYRLITLENRLSVLLISDSEADKAAAALDVYVGSGSDPRGREGLAHFLEHMLFLGTEKYPEAGEYQAFVASHGGRHNAYTSFEHTNYIFDVDADYLEPTLDRFAQFFIAPLFTERYVEQEKNAVNSEYSARSKSEGRRSLDALRQVVNPQHPFSKFSVGSLSTLSNGDTKIRDDLLAFYDRHYSANVMALVLMGREPIVQLEAMARDKFSAIADRDVQIDAIDTPLFLEGSLPARLSIIPEKELRQLSLSFPVPDAREHYRTKPISYISNILGHEGKGSLLSALKRRDWAESVSAGSGLGYKGGATFEVSISLTEQGLQHTDEIITMVYQTINRIRDNGIQQWLFDEQGRVGDIQFRFQEQSEPFHYVSRLASAIHYYDPQEILRGPYLMSEYAPELITSFLPYLKPENGLVKLVAKGLPVDKKSPWYETPFGFKAVNPELLAQWQNAGLSDEITLPEVNPFVPEKLVMQPRERMDKPLLLKDSNNFRLWYNQDELFPVPKSGLFFSVRSPLASDQVKHVVLADLYVSLLNDRLNEFAYPARLAGLQYRLSKHTRGFSVRISGYSEKQSLLLKRIIDQFGHADFDQRRFVTLKQEMLRRLRNASRVESYRILLRDINEVIYQPYWNDGEKIVALEALQFEDLAQYIAGFWQQVSVESFINGNTSSEQALNIAKLIQPLVSQPSEIELPPLQVVSMPEGQRLNWSRVAEHPDAAYVLYLQGRSNSYASQAEMALTAQIIESPFYEQIRTEQQLGYIVWASYMPLLTVPGVAFVVQSPSHSEQAIEVEVENFIKGFNVQSDVLTLESFEQHKRALIHQLLEKPRNLYEQTELFWLSIALSDSDFERKKKVAEAVEAITLPQWQAFYQSYLQLPAKRRQLLLQTAKGDQAGEDLKQIDDPKEIKEKQQFYSYP